MSIPITLGRIDWSWSASATQHIALSWSVSVIFITGIGLGLLFTRQRHPDGIGLTRRSFTIHNQYNNQVAFPNGAMLSLILEV